MRIDRDAVQAAAALRLASPGLATGRRQGTRRSPFRGRGVEFADYRPYTPGDDLRLVDWNVYARLETLLVRLFHEEVTLGLHLVLDASASMDAGTPHKADHAATLAACLAAVGLLHQDVVSLTVCAERDAHTRAQHAAHLPDLLTLLERAQPRATAHLPRALQAAALRRTDRLVLLSDLLLPDDQREHTLRLLAASAHHPALLHILAPEELHPDLDDLHLAIDAETGEAIPIQSGPEAARRYQEHLHAYLEATRRRCDQLGIRYVFAPTLTAPRDLMTGLLRRAHLTESATGEAP